MTFTHPLQHGSQVMSLGAMLSTTFSTSLASTLPKLTTDRSNWIIWKTRMQVFLGAKKIITHLDTSATPPKEPQPPASGATNDEIKTYQKEKEKCTVWTQEDTEAKHYIISTIPNSLLIKRINCKTTQELWKTICTEHEDKANIFCMEMIRQIHNE